MFLSIQTREKFKVFLREFLLVKKSHCKKEYLLKIMRKSLIYFHTLKKSNHPNKDKK